MSYATFVATGIEEIDAVTANVSEASLRCKDSSMWHKENEFGSFEDIISKYALKAAETIWCLRERLLRLESKLEQKTKTHDEKIINFESATELCEKSKALQQFRKHIFVQEEMFKRDALEQQIITDSYGGVDTMEDDTLTPKQKKEIFKDSLESRYMCSLTGNGTQEECFRISRNKLYPKKEKEKGRLRDEIEKEIEEAENSLNTSRGNNEKNKS